MGLPVAYMAIAKGSGCLNLGPLSRIRQEPFGELMQKTPFDSLVNRVSAAAFCAYPVSTRPIALMAPRVKGF